MVIVTCKPLELTVIVTLIISNPNPFHKIHHYTHLLKRCGSVEVNLEGRISRTRQSTWCEEAYQLPHSLSSAMLMVNSTNFTSGFSHCFSTIFYIIVFI